MALHDIDKNHSRRLTPSPNQNDQVSQRMAAGTTQHQNSGEQADDDGLRILERQILAKQDGENKAVFGFYGVANKFGLKVAKAGADVLTAGDSDLIFNSEQNLFKIITSSSVTFAVASLTSGSTTTQTVAHKQTGIPAVIAFVNGTGSTYLTANQYYSVPVTIPVAVAGKYEAGILYGFRVDATNIYFDVSNYTSASPITDIGTATFKYYVLQETAN